MAFTPQDLANVEKSLSSGERRVRLGDKEVEYRTLSELFQLWQLIRKQLQPSSPTSGRILASYSKGMK